MEWYKGQWCVTMQELTRDDRSSTNQADYLKPIAKERTLVQMGWRNQIAILRRGGGAGTPALIAVESLPERMREQLQMKYPDLEDRMRRDGKPEYRLFLETYKKDYRALAFYWDYFTSRHLTLGQDRLETLAEEYTVNASVIQAVLKIKSDNALYRKVRGRRGVTWADMAEVIRFYKEELGHTLGVSPTRFAQWVRKWEQEGYVALISKKFGNSNTQKVTAMEEQLLLAMAQDRHRPTDKKVWEWYCDFKAGLLDYFHPTTGELLNPSEYQTLSEKTVGTILQRGENRYIVASAHEGRHELQTQFRSHHNRRRPRYSLSMVTMDDKDFAIKVRFTKRTGGKPIETTLKAYLCYDVASEAIIGYSFSGEKTTRLFRECVQSMYRTLMRLGLGQPHEAQVENHLVSQFKDTMMKSGRLFPEVTFAGAENSQEKYAEGFNNRLKHQVEKYLSPEPVGRHYARLKSNRTKGRKVSDGTNVAYKQNVYDFDEAVRLYEAIFRAWNDAPHPNKKLYPEMTRWEVLQRCCHIEIQPINEVLLARWAGTEVKTSVSHKELIQVRGEKYHMPLEMQHRLSGRDRQLMAYYFDQQDGREIEEIHVYQDDVYLGACMLDERYQVSKLERTSEDLEKLAKQAKRLKAFDDAVRLKMPEPVERIDSKRRVAMELQPVAKVVAPLEGDYELQSEDFITQKKDIDYTTKALADL